MKRISTFIFFVVLSTSTFAHEVNHYADLFLQMLFPIALLGVLVCLPLTFLLAISKFNKKFSQLIYGGYVAAGFLFFGILKLVYSAIPNHSDLTCQIVAFGFYLSIISITIFIAKLILHKVKKGKKK